MRSILGRVSKRTALSIRQIPRKRFRKWVRRTLVGPAISGAPSPGSVPPPRSAQTPPILVVGMHRSGTTLLARILSQAGVFMGRPVTARTHESPFFVDINETIFALAHAYWDQPAPVFDLITSGTHHRLGHALGGICSSPWIFSYLGWKKYRRYRSLYSLNRPWGWKDPRNTFTLPLWLQVFPDAKVIHIVRNGVDVGQSLVVRARATMHLDRVSSVKCLSLPGAFEVWRQYVQAGLDHTAGLGPHRLLSINYEGLLSDPDAQLRKIGAFVDSPLSDEQLPELSAQLQTTRAFAFGQDPDLCAFYDDVRSDPMMRTLGYGEIDLLT
ncbi:sulfotransferase [Gemmatimonadota bacterium]